MSFLLLGILNAQAAGAAAGAYDLLETVNVTGSGVQVTFTGLGTYSDYKHLQLRIVAGRDNSSTTTAGLVMRLNNDSGSNYAYHTLSGNGSSVSSSAVAPSVTDFTINEVVGRDSANGIYGSAVIDFLDFSSTNKNKTIRYLAGSVASSEKTISLGSVLYMNTSALTEINVIGTLDAGSRLSLMGVK